MVAMTVSIVVPRILVTILPACHAGPLALHVSQREEPFGSPQMQTAVALLRRRYTDDQISGLFQLPQSHAHGYGCIVGLVDIEATWP